MDKQPLEREQNVKDAQIARLDLFAKPRVFVLTLDPTEASILALACETLRHRLESIARANKSDASLTPGERQTIKDACTAINSISPKLNGYAKGSPLSRLVRNLDMKWREARRQIARTSSQDHT